MRLVASPRDMTATHIVEQLPELDYACEQCAMDDPRLLLIQQ